MVSILNLKGPFTWCDSGCDKTATFVNIFSDIYTTHSEVKSLSQLHHVNTPLEINVTYYLHRPQSQSLSDRVNRPLGVFPLNNASVTMIYFCIMLDILCVNYCDSTKSIYISDKSKMTSPLRTMSW